MSDSTPMTDADDRDLNDPVLQRALRNAPDLAAAPEAGLRESIRALAHEAVAPSLPEGRVGAQRPWWQRFLGIGAGGGRMPRNAAFATVLLGVLITATWHQQEIPDARLDAVAPATKSPRNEPAPAPPARTDTPASPTAPDAAAAKPAPAPAPTAEASGPAPSTLEAALAESRAIAEAAARAVEKEELTRQRQADRVRQSESDAAAALARLQGRPPPSALAPLPAPRAPVAAMPPPAAAAPPLGDPSVVAGQRAPLASEADGAFAKRGAVAESAGAAPAPSAKARLDTGGSPTFNALSQWTRLRITRAGGESRSLARAEARDLSALVGSAALAGVGSQPLSGSPDWRIALERNGEVLAVLELAGGQVRWRENGMAPGTGAPGAGALAALREALEDAAAAAPPPAPGGAAAPTVPNPPAR